MMTINVTLPLKQACILRLSIKATRACKMQQTDRGLGGRGKLLLVWQETEKLSHETSRTGDILTQAQSTFSV